MFTDYFDSPLGLMEIKASSQGITQVIFCGEQSSQVNEAQSITNELTKRCKLQLAEYFTKQRQTFDLPLAPQGTPFQQQIWHCLSQIPFGQTLSYGQIAQQINNPKSVRAVGGANGRNPITIIVPCHRVIGANGSLTGYAGGTERKLWLLEHEGIVIIPSDNNNQRSLKQVIKTRQEKTQFLS
ncbi:methylated-DNA--[protein]-cysteine S-methyltransferase [Psychrobium sp. 1_MG-2023]|uniref:methylated-DNA--[protein]-cysteine S-methyltransferase n=1 Tax=Psychrobium sp. 1_MG-2023 TaxID=3062624 RepID=UPI0027373DB0|nr:methylated-DNA--[protein]-cysteine S-methyltransferase [Psychrobium sp. 1_MG-2023]MDP2560779.1 methylated-DNA--[protein]-cysteine S-methyltransferase [Psychrobium sp. 1_MG-2023]